MTAITVAGFEARYRADPDPWGYQSSPYERDKYAATLAACGRGPFSSALELGGSIGVFSQQLAPRCGLLTTIECAPTAAAAARARLAGCNRVNVIVGTIPDDVPRRRYDLVVASEILYYLRPKSLEATLALLARVLEPGGRLVAVHWRPAGPERPFTATQIHSTLRAQPWLTPRRSTTTCDYLLDALERT
ncbi:MAG: SAM-dependent methyltransferase [Solirubrobacteraceae bacterium]